MKKLIPLLLLTACIPGLSSNSATSTPSLRSAIIISTPNSDTIPAIALIEMKSYHPTVTSVVLDSNRTAVGAINSRGFPQYYVVILKPNSSVDTIGYVYSRWNPYWTGGVMSTAADSIHKYAPLDASVTIISRGMFERVRPILSPTN